jgi:hypothetical protein
MPRSIYGDGKPVTCTYTPPEGQDVQVYLQKLLSILTTFENNGNKDITLKGLETLKEILTLVKLNNP